VPVGDALATADAVADLLDDGDKARAFGVAGRARARAEFSIAAHAQQIETIYEEMLGLFETRR